MQKLRIFFIVANLQFLVDYFLLIKILKYLDLCKLNLSFEVNSTFFYNNCFAIEFVCIAC